MGTELASEQFKGVGGGGRYGYRTCLRAVQRSGWWGKVWVQNLPQSSSKEWVVGEGMGTELASEQFKGVGGGGRYGYRTCLRAVQRSGWWGKVWVQNLPQSSSKEWVVGEGMGTELASEQFKGVGGGGRYGYRTCLRAVQRSGWWGKVWVQNLPQSSSKEWVVGEGMGTELASEQFKGVGGGERYGYRTCLRAVQRSGWWGKVWVQNLPQSSSKEWVVGEGMGTELASEHFKGAG